MKPILHFLWLAIKNNPRRFTITVVWSLVASLGILVIPLTLRYFILQLGSGRWLPILVGGTLFYAAMYLGATGPNIIAMRASDEFSGSFMTQLLTDIEKSLADTNIEEIAAFGRSRLEHVLYTDIIEVGRIIGNHLTRIFSSVIVILAGLFFAF